jgi:hypothetical protein
MSRVPRPGSGARRAGRPDGEGTSAAELEDAERLKAAYTNAYRALQEALLGRKSFYKPSPMFDGHPGSLEESPRESVWLKAARALRRLGYDPEAYVRAQFDVYSKNGPPRPDQLTSPSSVRLYEHRCRGEEVVARERFSLGSQVEVAKQRIEALVAGGYAPEDAWYEVLLDPDVDLSPLFRYCLAVSISRKADAEDERFAELSAELKPAAVAQYTTYQEAFDAEWVKFLPRGFPEG